MASLISVVADHISVIPTPSITHNNVMIFFLHHTRSLDSSLPIAAYQRNTLRVDRFFYLNREILSSSDNRYFRFLFGILTAFNFGPEAYSNLLRRLLFLALHPAECTGDIDIVVQERIVASVPRVGHDQPSDSSFVVETFIESLKMKEDGEVDEGEICPVCMDDLRGTKVVVELPCFHLFHKDCITTWFNRNPTCPICRCNFPQICS